MAQHKRLNKMYDCICPKVEKFLGLKNKCTSQIVVARFNKNLPAFYNLNRIVCNKYYLNDPHLECILAHEIVHDILDDYGMPDKKQSNKVLVEGIVEIAVREVVDKNGGYTKRFMPQDERDIHCKGYKIVGKIFQNSGRRGLKELINNLRKK